MFTKLLMVVFNRHRLAVFFFFKYLHNSVLMTECYKIYFGESIKVEKRIAKTHQNNLNKRLLCHFLNYTSCGALGNKNYKS